jgi:type VI secretion system secreted protein VgrG
MPPSQSNRAAQLTTPLPQDTLVFRSLSGFERLSLPFEYRISALATSREVDLDGLLGEVCTLTAQITASERRHFHGRCAQIGFVGNEDGGLLYELTIRPDFWFLSRNRNCRIFQNMSAADIVSQLLQERGITRFKLKLEHGFPPKRRFCVQYMESDFAFISRLLEHEGMHYFFRHDQNGHEMIIADSNSAHDQIPGHETIPYYPPNSTIERERSNFDDWAAVHGVAAPASLKATDFFHEHPQPMKKSGRTDSAYTGDDAEMQLHPAGYEEASYGEKLAGYRLEAERAMRAYATSSGNTLGLTPGCTFTLRNHPHQPQNREHLVVETRIHLEADDYSAGVGLTGGQPERVDVVTIPSDRVFRPLLSTPRPRIPGTQTAIVVGKSGEEIETQDLGAVKVSFHWDTYSKNDETSSCWVRVGQAWAGGGWGALFTPRIGMEVMVEFIDGDPDRPIITGCVYNGDNAPPYGLPGAKTRSTIKSNSSKGGGGFNELRFEDKKGMEEIYIHAQKDQNVEILHDLSTTVGNMESRKVAVNRTTNIGANETKTVGASESETIGASKTKTIGASETMTVGVAQTETIGAARTTSIGAMDSLTVGAAQTVSVGLGQTINVGGVQSTSVGGAAAITVGGALAISAGGAITMTAGGAIMITAPVVTVMGGLVVVTGKAVQVG